MGSPKRKRKTHRPAREIARHADRILAEAFVKSKEFEKRGLRTVTLPRAVLIRKLSGKTAHSPFLTSISWGNAVRGTTFPLTFGIMNPDPWTYFEANLALCVYWGTGTGVAPPGESLLAADPALGVRAVDVSILNSSPSPYYVSASHLLPATLAPGSNRSDVSYLLYAIDPFDVSVILERGSLSVAIS